MTDKELDAILNEIKKKHNDDNGDGTGTVSKSVLENFDSAEKHSQEAEDVADVAPKAEKVDDFGLEPPVPSKNVEDVADDVDDADDAEVSLADIKLDDDENKGKNIDVELPEDKPKNGKKGKKKSKKPLIIILIIVLLVAIGAGVYFGFFYNKKDTTTTTTTTETTETTTEAIENTGNPLTGESSYNQDALTQRPVAVVVENEYSSKGVRPQWGLTDADMVMEGESEVSTRLLLFWADFNEVPEQVGPTRSARPPFIKFSELFDSVFIHAGLSHTTSEYVGADTVFKQDNVDHVNLLKYEADGTYLGRDYSRTQTLEHTGFLNGTNVAKMLEEEKIDTKLDSSKMTKFAFFDDATDVGSDDGTSVTFKWSDECPDTATWTYDQSTKTYKTDHFDSVSSGETSGVEFTNLIFLMDETEYVTKNNYKSEGNSETYCNYKLAGGNGMLVSNGTATAITWGVKDGKLWMKNADGEDVKLNVGKSYIGYGSSNNGGAITLGSTEDETTTESTDY